MEYKKTENKYTVATYCFTYNQESYIEDTLNGFSKQETTFPVVYIVIDDASTDRTPEVLCTWCNNNLQIESDEEPWKQMPYGRLREGTLKGKPHLQFVFLLLDENHYQTGKREKCFGYIDEWLDNSLYIAICEGDDYWTAPLKLQKQVDYLESNPDVVMCYTRCILFNESTQTFGEEYGWQVNDFYHLFESNLIQTLTTVFRKSVYKEYIENVRPFSKKWLLEDYPMWLYFALRYKIHLIDECTSVYRYLEESASHSNNFEKQVKFEQSVLDVRKFFAQMCPNSQELITKADEKYHDMLFYEASKCQNLQGMIEFIGWKIKQQEDKYATALHDLNIRMTSYETNNQYLNKLLKQYNTINQNLQNSNQNLQNSNQNLQNSNQNLQYNNQNLQYKRKKYRRLFISSVIMNALFLMITISAIIYLCIK